MQRKECLSRPGILVQLPFTPQGSESHGSGSAISAGMWPEPSGKTYDLHGYGSLLFCDCSSHNLKIPPSIVPTMLSNPPEVPRWLKTKYLISLASRSPIFLPCSKLTFPVAPTNTVFSDSDCTMSLPRMLLISIDFPSTKSCNTCAIAMPAS